MQILQIINDLDLEIWIKDKEKTWRVGCKKSE